MKINAIKFNGIKREAAGQESELKALILLSALFACGMILGAGIFNADAETARIIKNILTELFSLNKTSIGLSSVVNSIVLNISIFAIMMFMAFNCTGIPVIIISIFLRGVGYGIISGYLLSEFLLAGIGYYLIIILPSGIMLCAAFIITGIYSYFSSFNLIRILSGKKSAEKQYITDFFIKIIPCIIMTIFASLLNVFSCTAFSGLFEII